MIDRTDDRFERLVQQIEPGSKLLRAWALTGGVSAQVIALEIERPDRRRQKLVVRQHGALDLQHNPHIAADEFKLLQIVVAAGVAAPKPYFVDDSGQIFPMPYLVIEYIEGTPDFAPTPQVDGLSQIAATLARIHQVDGSDGKLAFLPEQAEHMARTLQARLLKPDDSLQEGRIRAVLEAVWPLPGRNQPALLHGDYWTGNLLWRDGQLAAVIDWEDAAVGDPLADLGNSRLEILWAYGVEAMQAFTRGYQSLMPAFDYTDLPYWDLCAALRPAGQLAGWGLDAHSEHTMRERHRWFVEQAFEHIGV